MNKAHAILAGAGGVAWLAACGGPIEQAEGQAADACLRLFLERHAVWALPAWDEAQAEFNSMNDASAQATALYDDGFEAGPSAMRYLSTGNYVLDHQVVLRKGEAPHRFTCTGDFNRRRITSLQADGMIARPPAGQNWSF